MDDDVYTRTLQLERFLDAHAHHVPRSFGFYGCGSAAGAAKCVLEQHTFAVPRPHCYPVIAIMSSASMHAIQPALQNNFILRSVRMNHLDHDTGLGILLWSVGTLESDSLLPYVGWASTCYNSSTLERNPDCPFMVAMHSKGLDMRRLFKVISEETEMRALDIVDADCIGTDTAFQFISALARDSVTANESISARKYLDDCLGLDRPAFVRT